MHYNGDWHEEVFGVLTVSDVKATLKQKLDVAFRRHVILVACTPSLAHRSLGAEPLIGLLHPCNVVAQDTAEGGIIVIVARADPRAMFALVDNTDVTPGNGGSRYAAAPGL